MERPFAITLDVGSSRANKTGSWRTERPVYVHRLPPCSSACPAGEDVQQWLYDAEEGDGGYERAWRRIMEDNPFPAVMGRVCYHPCETKCNRAQLDEAVGINSVERFLGDEAIARGWKVEVTAPPSGKRVLVVGAGPSGLSAAYHLVRLGHAVTIYDAGPRPGGMMRFGIPTYRLPRDVLDAEIQRILDLGVDARAEPHGHERPRRDARRAGSTPSSSPSARISASAPTFPPARPRRCSTRSSLLRSMEGEEAPLLGRRVVVYGGGNTAIDAARTARRLGAEEAIIVYRRTRDRMPAHDFEVEEALDEGVLDEVALHHQARRRRQARRRADGAGRDRLSAAHRRARGARGGLARARARPGDRPLARRGRPRPRGRGRRRLGRLDDDDGVRRHLRRRRHGSRRAHRDGRGRARQAGSAQHRRLAPRQPSTRRLRSARSPTSSS